MLRFYIFQIGVGSGTFVTATGFVTANAYEIAIGSLGTAIVCLFGYIATDWLKCKKTIEAMRLRLEALEAENGERKGQLTAYGNCPAARCPFQRDNAPDPY